MYLLSKINRRDSVSVSVQVPITTPYASYGTTGGPAGSVAPSNSFTNNTFACTKDCVIAAMDYMQHGRFSWKIVAGSNIKLHNP